MPATKRFPKVDEGVEPIITFRDSHFSDYNVYRDRHMARIVMAIYYDLGNQWIERDTNVIEGGRGYVFREQQLTGEVELPRPVTNHCAPAVDVEFATLAKRQWTPKIPTFSRDPRMEAAAKVANEILSDRLKKLGWDDLRDKFIRNCIAHGTAIIKSFWDASYYETTWVSSEEPKVCTQCNAMFSSDTVPEGFAEKYSENRATKLEDFDGMGEVKLGNCPCCSGALADYDLDEETSKSGKDIFGRAMGKLTPRGNTAIEIITPFEYFPQNAGIFYNTSNVKLHGICKVRSLDWVEEHYPEYADQIEPEDPVELMAEHPILGEWDLVGRFDTGYDTGLLDNHVRVYEMIHEPTYRFPKGRYVVVIGKRQSVVVKNDDLIREVSDAEGTASVPEVCIAAAVWKHREGEFWGKSLVDDLISPQNRVNGIDAQVIEARERMGSPNLMVPEDADLQGPESRVGYGGAKVFRYQLSALNPNAKPEVFGSVLMPSGVYQERQAVLQDMTKIIGPADIEIGEAPRNVTTTSGLQILGEQAERRRGTREREITSAIQKIWEHQLALLWTLRVDTDYYEAQTPDGTWEMKQYSRQHIKGQTKVIVEKQAYIDRSIIMREAAREAMVDGLYTIDSPLAKKRLLELRGLPTDVNEDTTLQIDHAKRVWADFVDEGKIPVIDVSIDNPAIRFQVLGTMLLQDEGKRIAEAALWPAVLPLIAGWEEDLMQLDQLDAKIRAQYGGEPPKEEAEMTFAKLTAAYQQAQEGQAMMQKQQEQIALQSGQPPQPLPPLEPPLPPNFVPRQFEGRIFMVWQSLIEKHGGLADALVEESKKTMKPVEAIMQEVDKFLRFRSVVEAYRLLGAPAPAPGTLPGPPGAAAGGGVPPGGPTEPQAPPQPPGGNPMEQGR